jgi:hypothetical protein
MDLSIQFGENRVSAVEPSETTAIGEDNCLELLRG